MLLSNVRVGRGPDGDRPLEARLTGRQPQAGVRWLPEMPIRVGQVRLASLKRPLASFKRLLKFVLVRFGSFKRHRFFYFQRVTARPGEKKSASLATALPAASAQVERAI